MIRRYIREQGNLWLADLAALIFLAGFVAGCLTFYVGL